MRTFSGRETGFNQALTGMAENCAMRSTHLGATVALVAAVGATAACGNAGPSVAAVQPPAATTPAAASPLPAAAVETTIPATTAPAAATPVVTTPTGAPAAAATSQPPADQYLKGWSRDFIAVLAPAS